MNFKLIKFYHKPYRLFTDDYVLNIGTITPVQKNETNASWVKNNVSWYFESNEIFDKMNSEFSPWHKFASSNFLADDTVVSFQHYSKVLDLTSIKTVPYHDLTQHEDQNGEKYRQCKSLDEFGYNKLNELFLSYDIIVGNQYPCSIYASIRAGLSLDISDVLNQFRNIVVNLNDKMFTLDRLVAYCKSGYQYWRGGPVITTLYNYKRLLDFTIKFEHAFLDSKDYINQTIYNNKDGRGGGYLGEMIMGFAIYCLIDEFKINNKRIGYCKLLTDSNVIFGNTRL